MPGHVVKTTGPDPDPLPWLAVSEELKKKLMTKPYDTKKSCWVPDKATGGYFEGLIQGKDGDKVTVEVTEFSGGKERKRMFAKVKNCLDKMSSLPLPSHYAQACSDVSTF